MPAADNNALMFVEYGEDTLSGTNSTYLNLCADGVLTCLDSCLRSMLLYKSEWEAYDKLKQTNAADEDSGKPFRHFLFWLILLLDENTEFLPRKHYGYIHLLRMLTKLNRVFEISKVAADFRDMINSNVYDFMMFLSKKHSTYFDEKEDYQQAVEE